MVRNGTHPVVSRFIAVLSSFIAVLSSCIAVLSSCIAVLSSFIPFHFYLILNIYCRQADLNGDGRLTVEEIFAIFKVIPVFKKENILNILEKHI